jgi:glycerol-3-phosphate dehydrogenase
MSSFSSLERRQNFKKLTDDHWDLLIIGGGITGAGILLDAVSRGLKAALVEKKDYAWGTSSRSTKLIHGGLRYLKQLEVKLVREVGLERAIVYKNAMHVVRPEKMLLPIVEKGSLGRYTSSLGLWVYDWLADVEKEERRKMLAKEETLKLEPLLGEKTLKGGGIYYEYRTDDARLTIEVLKKAVEMGGLALNYAEVTDFLKDNHGITGAVIQDQLSGADSRVKAKVVVNSAGPWVDDLRKLDENTLPPRHLYLTKGVHLVAPRERLPLQQSVYFDVEADDRMIFCIPRDRVVYMGTTDTPFKGDIDTPLTTREDAEYILEAVNHMFPSAHLKIEEMESSWAGLRPLIHQQGKDPSDISRKDEIFISPNGLISIAGGKLTGYRKMAERITDRVIKALKQEESRNFKQVSTQSIKLAGCPYASEEEMQNALEELQHHFSNRFPLPSVERLFYRYGANASQILEVASKDYADHSSEEALLKSELDYAVAHEMVHGIADFFHRRTGMIYFEYPQVGRQKEKVLEHLATHFEWDEDRKRKEMEELNHILEEVIHFKR